MRLFPCALFAVVSNSLPVSAAVEQCRFIQAKSDREACYERQDRALAAKRTSGGAGNVKTMDQEAAPIKDDALNRSLRSICRGC
jgi:predicted signal transduction protein with EAL and GGDEF domain